MTAGRSEDRDNTRKIVRGEMRVKPGTSWLRHKGKQAVKIDEMILAHAYTKRDIAEAIGPLSETNGDNIDVMIQRVQNHIKHLEKTWNGEMSPHGLKVREDSQGRLYFDVD